MRNVTSLLIALGIVVGFIGCESFTKGYDTNPLAPSDAPAEKVFAGAEAAFIEFTEGYPSMLASIWAQQIHGAERQFSGYNSYTVSSQDFANDWFLAYTRVLANLRLTQQKAAASGANNLVGVAKILEGIHMGTVAALWGDVPYSEAARPDVTTTPKYDNQLDVYTAVQNVLSDGITTLSSNKRPLAQDAFSYAGNPALWIKAAHSAKARYFMHVARHNGYDAATLNQVISEAQQGITALSGGEDLMFKHPTGTYQGDMNLWYSFLVFDRSGYIDAVGNFAFPMMKALPRDGKTDESGRMKYYFTSDGKDLNTSDGAYTETSPYPVIRASETHLLMAEAYARLGDVSNALAHLNMARQYNNNVFKNHSQDFTATDFPTANALLQAILNEEYLSLMHQIEAFNFLRRVNYNVAYTDSLGNTVRLTPTNGTQFPQRFLYSSDEINSNPHTPVQRAEDLFNPTRVNQ